MSKKYKAAAYLRLSYTDDRSAESDSISTQRKLIQDFLVLHPDIELVSEQIDDGYSGILFNRPAFQAMLSDIKNGTVNCVIVKDLSRLGREHVDTSRYLRQIFPALGVRFIAVTDHIDSEDEHTGDDLVVSIKSILNDNYCRDISIKTRSALQAKRQNGDYVGACPIYGYRRDPENKNHLVPDEYAAQVVRDIYRLRINGASADRIATELNRLGVLSPLAYKISKGLPHPTGGCADHPGVKWSAVTVIRILQDETYTGTLVQGRQTTHNYKLKNQIKKLPEEWVRTENAHEAIISRQDFDLVQKLAQLDTRAAAGKDSVYLFSGILVCGCCGGRMTRKVNTYKGRKYVYYRCPTGKAHGCSHPAMIREDVLVQCVLACLQAHIKSVISLGELLANISEERINRNLVEGYKAQIAETEVQLAQITRFKTSLYENFASGIIDKSEYKSLSRHYTTQAEQLRDAISSLQHEMEQALNNSNDRLKWVKQFREFETMSTLDRRAVVTLIQSIRVVSKEELQIHFRFQDEYEKALKMLSSCKEVG